MKTSVITLCILVGLTGKIMFVIFLDKNVIVHVIAFRVI